MNLYPSTYIEVPPAGGLDADPEKQRKAQEQVNADTSVISARANHVGAKINQIQLLNAQPSNRSVIIDGNSIVK